MGALRVFGIRHHGPGSARSLQNALESYQPDVILVEGPPEADDALALAGRAEMKPPVALLIYLPDEPQRAVFYPFAAFSPEWIAIQYGYTSDVPVRFMDLPLTHRFVMQATLAALPDTDKSESEGGVAQTTIGEPGDDEFVEPEVSQDPLGRLASLAGFPDGERWWDYLVESRGGAHTAVFEAIADAMSSLREDHQPRPHEFEPQREAFMRKTIRAALKAGHERVAVVCGAWHAPALLEPNAKGQVIADNALLKGLPKAKVSVAWTPWSYDRLSFQSGYGAGVESPAYYHLLWSHARNPAVHWMTRAARLMRRKDLDASSAQVIEAVRLAEALAALRERPLPGLYELNEAALTVLCGGEQAPLKLIRRKLVIGDRLGAVPDDAPQIPLQTDLQKLQKRLRMPASANEKDFKLDLRKPLDLERSHLLHRMNLIGIRWGAQQMARGAKGTFQELWRVRWEPEFVIELITAGRWGNTVADAAAGLVRERASTAESLTKLTELVDDTLLADLPAAVSYLLQALQNRAAVASDTLQLMASIPPLARVSRYGNVRQTDASVVLTVVDGLVARVCAGLPAAAGSLNDEAAAHVFELITSTHEAITLLDQAHQREQWFAVLEQLARAPYTHGLVTSRATRLLHDTGQWDIELVEQQLSLALSRAADPMTGATWLEGFLSGSGQVLLHDDVIWGLIDEWVHRLSEDHFTAALPLLRRTFATFLPAERRQMGERVKRGGASSSFTALNEFDDELANAAIPLLATILGVDLNAETRERD
ncbi:MAG: DUF5682 family protein [Phycisphaerae bacterium]